MPDPPTEPFPHNNGYEQLQHYRKNLDEYLMSKSNRVTIAGSRNTVPHYSVSHLRKIQSLYERLVALGGHFDLKE